MTLTVNRCLKDKAMDHIDHALGRPLDPMVESDRNYFATDGLLAMEMAISLFWTDGGPKHGPRIMRFFHVTEAGRAALVSHLRSIDDPNRAFVVTFDGYSRTVVATTHAKARYSDYLTVSECWSELTFKRYCQRATVRLAASRSKSRAAPAVDEIAF